MDVLCTHPMFGPDSGKSSWKGLNFMYEVVRVGHDAQRLARIENFLRVRSLRWPQCRCQAWGRALARGGAEVPVCLPITSATCACPPHFFWLCNPRPYPTHPPKPIAPSSSARKAAAWWR
jgi:hypothetical protein